MLHVDHSGMSATLVQFSICIFVSVSRKVILEDSPINIPVGFFHLDLQFMSHSFYLLLSICWILSSFVRLTVDVFCFGVVFLLL